MNTIIFWASLGLLVLALLIGLGVGIIRGVKRSAVHIAFLVASFIVAFFLTKTITKAILGITLPIDNGKYTISGYILYMINKSFDLSAFDSASAFIKNLPTALVAPILFIVLSLVVYLLFDIAYLITARLAFGKKKEEFKEQKPYRAFGGVLGIVEGLFVVMMMFGPISALTGTYKEIVHASEISTSVQANGLKTASQYAQDSVPKTVDDIVMALDKSACIKLPKVFGLNNLMFDYLSNFKVDGEKIYIRKELSNFAYAYDDFVEVYNLIKEKRYTDVSFVDLRTSVDYVLDGNLFRVVLCDSINKIVTDYENVKEKLPFKPPALMEDVIKELQTRFSEKNFDTALYLKHDVKSAMNVAETLFRNDLISKYKAIENKKDFIQILEFVSENNQNITTLTDNALALNLVADSFNVFAEKGASAVEKTFEGKEHEVKLNTNFEDNSKVVRDLLNAVDSVLELNEKIKLSDLLTSDDIAQTLAGVEDVYNTMLKVGQTFDKLRELELLVVPPEMEGGQNTYMFDNILKNYKVDLLGDEVYLTLDAEEKTKLDTYTKFFEFIAGPIDLAKDLGLTDFGKEEVSFDTIFDKVLLALKIDDERDLTKVAMTFYQLNAMNLKELVFDKIVTNLQSNVDILSFDGLISQDDYRTWVKEFDAVGRTLNKLNEGKGEIEGYGDTYIKYLLTEDADLEKLMKTMLEKDRLSGVLDEVFSAEIFGNLTKDIFDTLDKSVKDMTGTTSVELPTDLTNLEATKAETIETIEAVLNLVLSDTDLQIADYGKILQLLKVNASNNGQKNGVFNNIFVRLIWYMTGDDLSAGKQFATLSANKDAADIKAFLNTTDYYSDDLNFEDLMIKAEKAVELAEKLDQNVDFTITEENTVEDVVGGIKESLNEMSDQEKVDAINDLKDLLGNKQEDLLSDIGPEQKQALEQALSSEENFGSSPDVLNALKDLLGLGE